MKNKSQILEYAHNFFKTGRDVAETNEVNRGVIYDRNLKELAVSMDKVSVYAIVRELESPRETAMRLAPAVNRSEESLSERLKDGTLQVWLAENITQEEEDAVRRLGLKGVFLYKEKVRYYPQKEKVSHLLGFAENQMGVAGVEYIYNQKLNQYGGSIRDALSTDTSDRRRNSHNLILTIDLKIQEILERYVSDISSAYEGVRMGAMVMETRSGNIVGCVNVPSYDPNRFREYKKGILDNIFLEPVAVPKAIRSFLLDVAALNAENEKEGTEVLPWSIGAPGAQNLASDLRLWERLGLNDPPRLDFASESDMPKRAKPLSQEGRSGGNEASLPMVATPVQILTAVNRVVNGGRSVTPRVVDPEKNGGEAPPAGVNAAVLRPEVSAEAQNLYAALTQGGPIATPLASGGLSGDGLSFTSTNGIDDFLRNQMMLIFIPAKGAELAILVAVDYSGFDPAGTGRAGMADLVTPGMKMILPIVTLQQVLTHLFDMMKADENEKKNLPSLQPEASAQKPGEPRPEVKEPLKMPDLQGMSLRKSLRTLKPTALEIRVQGTGRVVSQSPPAGTVLTDIRECSLVLQSTVDKSKPGKEITKGGKKPEGGSGHETKKK